jgi:hypothetical protein
VRAVELSSPRCLILLDVTYICIILHTLT